MNRSRLCAAALLAGLALLFSAPEVHAEKRVALVVGNSAYQNTPKLTNPVNDADDVANALRQVGFAVILERDLEKRGMERAIAQFAREARDADAALFYYAGHGLQHRGLNYLMPTDARLDDEFSLNFEMTRLEDVLLSLGQARGVKILVLDACRRNPLVDRLAGVATTRDFAAARGLARLDATRGMVVAFSTQADQVAVDGVGRNSPFAAALVKQISEPGVEIGTVFRRVAADVNLSTKGRQLPELSVSLLGEFYFTRADSDVQAWSKIRTSQDAGELTQFIGRYPSSPLVTDARERIEAIERVIQARMDHERVEREKMERERLERERVARDQAEGERLQREQAERERIAREQIAATAEPAVTAAPAGNVQSALLTQPSQSAPVVPPTLEGAALVRELKKELTRVGCYGGRIDEKWPAADATAAIKKFATYAKLPTPATEPEIGFLEAVREKSGRVCPLECNARQVERDGRCVAKTCSSGFELDNDGACNPKRNVASRPDSQEGAKTRSPSYGDATQESFKVVAKGAIPTGQAVTVTAPNGRKMTCIGGRMGSSQLPRRCTWN